LNVSSDKISSVQSLRYRWRWIDK